MRIQAEPSENIYVKRLTVFILAETDFEVVSTVYKFWGL